MSDQPRCSNYTVPKAAPSCDGCKETRISLNIMMSKIMQNLDVMEAKLDQLASENSGANTGSEVTPEAEIVPTCPPLSIDNGFMAQLFNLTQQSNQGAGNVSIPDQFRDHNDQNSMPGSSTSRPKLRTIVPLDGMKCANCQTETTTFWRKDAENRHVCNACGQYYRKHKKDRPVKFHKEVISSRYRHSKVVAKRMREEPTPSTVAMTPNTTVKTLMDLLGKSGQGKLNVHDPNLVFMQLLAQSNSQ